MMYYWLSLTNIGATIKAAESISHTVYIRLTRTPAVREPGRTLLYCRDVSDGGTDVGNIYCHNTGYWCVNVQYIRTSAFWETVSFWRILEYWQTFGLLP